MNKNIKRERRIQKKIILNKNHPDHIEVAIGEIEVYQNRFGESIHYIVSFGGDKSIRIVGKKNWNAFVDMIQWLHWDPEETQELYIPTYERIDTKGENTQPYTNPSLNTQDDN